MQTVTAHEKKAKKNKRFKVEKTSGHIGMQRLMVILQRMAYGPHSSLIYYPLASFETETEVLPHCAGGIWKRRFHSENASNVFCSHYAGGIVVFAERRSENHVIIVTSSFSENLRF